MQDSMERFIAYRLNFTCETDTGLRLPGYNGSTLRGAFFWALRHDFCLNKKLNTCLDCPAAEACPICRLVATVERDGSRGAEIPRPFAIEPVLGCETVYPQGQTFSFCITLFGESLPLFPYAILAIQRMGEVGMGDRKIAPGRFHLKETRVTNPLTGFEKVIYSDETRIVNVPDMAITQGDVLDYAARLNARGLGLSLLTPLRLVVEGSLVRKLTFRVFIQRLLRRLTDLYRYCCDEELKLDFAGLLKGAEEVRVVRDDTRWFDLSSYSRRRQSSTPVGGLVGNIAFEGILNEFLPLLVWGEITHVGKDATRGNGWYRIADSLS